VLPSAKHCRQIDDEMGEPITLGNVSTSTTAASWTVWNPLSNRRWKNSGKNSDESSATITERVDRFFFNLFLIVGG
jgi:hypothetical protein